MDFILAKQIAYNIYNKYYPLVDKKMFNLHHNEKKGEIDNKNTD